LDLLYIWIGNQRYIDIGVCAELVWSRCGAENPGLFDIKVGSVGVEPGQQSGYDPLACRFIRGPTALSRMSSQNP